MPESTSTTTVRQPPRVPAESLLPKSGLKATKMPTATMSTMMMGRMTSLSRLEATLAPNPEQTSAMRRNRAISALSKSTFRARVTAAEPVPVTAASLLVPKAAAGARPGRTASSIGIRINPPPPMTASTHPAAAVPKKRIIHCTTSISMPPIINLE